jgi:hypothetical protein
MLVIDATEIGSDQLSQLARGVRLLYKDAGRPQTSFTTGLFHDSEPSQANAPLPQRGYDPKQRHAAGASLCCSPVRTGPATQCSCALCNACLTLWRDIHLSDTNAKCMKPISYVALDSVTQRLGSLGSSVSIATGCRLYGQKSIPGRGNRFFSQRSAQL